MPLETNTTDCVMDPSWYCMQLVSNAFLVDRQAGSFKSGKKFFIDTMQLGRRGGRGAFVHSSSADKMQQEYSCLLTPFDQCF